MKDIGDFDGWRGHDKKESYIYVVSNNSNDPIYNWNKPSCCRILLDIGFVYVMMIFYCIFQIFPVNSCSSCAWLVSVLAVCGGCGALTTDWLEEDGGGRGDAHLLRRLPSTNTDTNTSTKSCYIQGHLRRNDDNAALSWCIKSKRVWS